MGCNQDRRRYQGSRLLAGVRRATVSVLAWFLGPDSTRFQEAPPTRDGLNGTGALRGPLLGKASLGSQQIWNEMFAMFKERVIL